MTLSEIRNLVKERSGRYDLVNADGSDNGMDHFIRAASDYLDLNVDHQGSFGWDRVYISHGNAVAKMSKKMRTILRANIADGGVRSKLVIKRNINEVIDMHESAGVVRLGKPIYGSVVSVNTVSRIKSLFGDLYESTDVFKSICDRLGSDWSYNSKLGHNETKDEMFDVLKLINLGYESDPTIVYPTMTYTVDGRHHYYIEFWAKGIVFSGNIDYSAYYGTITVINNPPLKPYYQRYKIKYSPLTSGVADTDYIYLYPFTKTIDGAPLNSIVLMRDLTIRKYSLDDGYLDDPIKYKPLLIYPASDKDYVVNVYGRIMSDTLENDTDENFWSYNYPELLILATCYQLEVSLRNRQGMDDWLNAMSSIIRSIQSDTYEQELDELDKMEG